MHSGISLPVAPPEEGAVLEDVVAPDVVVVVTVEDVVPGLPMAPLVPVPSVGALVLVDGSV